MNPFKSKDFDSLIAKGLQIEGKLILAPASTTQIDGVMSGESITVDEGPNGPHSRGSASTMLVINGEVVTIKSIVVPNVTITGKVKCDSLEVVGVLAIKKGAIVDCARIEYNTLIVETGAIINGHFEHITTRQAIAPIEPVKV
jgi:cytoskeletal protein CcmA (bactofilin family)